MRSAPTIIAAASAVLGAALVAKDALAFTASRNLHRALPTAGATAKWELSAVDTKVETQVCLEKLEKRLKEGPGALSRSEISDVEAAMARIVEHLNAAAAETTPSPAQSTEPDNSAPATPPPPMSEEQRLKLHTAALQMDATTVTSLLEAGMQMDEETTDGAFWAVVNAVDRAEAQDEPLSGDVPVMLHHIFEADHRHLLTREKLQTNVTCMMPDEAMGIEGQARRMNYIFDDNSHKDLPLTEGRVCEGGDCCDKCSRNIFPTFATDAESDLERFSELSKLTFNDLEKVSAATIIQFVRLVERVRRTIAHEYGLPLKTLLPLQAYSRKYVAGTTQKGGGGGEGDFVILHTDEATHSGYHYSCVLYLSTQGVDFEGGDFVFNDPIPKEEMPDTEENEYELDLMSLEEEIRRTGRKFTPFHPTRGAAVIFSSGWENMHEVEKITSGTRYAVPCFFTTCPVPDAAYEQMHVGKPKTNEDIADDWLHLLLAHREESPVEGVGRVKELLMKWHMMCAPLSEH
eukprot:CAMPEP_0183707748 /NCGR_PEP_ID=MMETSP0737-20130205/4233_1 /TAXON_ID=385413 /ORGANISM="Thalassiosira miniscula, Strain CCMP1093" /LENGTH=516 /DNA_ID=CAMNT_0025935477 /DNA_START=12 /DNA_END=1562 /DNA_ORIENTATION=-